MSILKIVLIENIKVDEELTELTDYTEGLYLINDSLYLVDQSGNAWFLWGGIQNYLKTDIIEEEKATLKSSAEEDMEAEDDIRDYECPEIPLDRELKIERVNEVDNSGFNMISHDLLLKCIAISQDPSLAFKDNS